MGNFVFYLLGLSSLYNKANFILTTEEIKIDKLKLQILT